MTNENTMWLVRRMNSDDYTATLFTVDPLKSRDIRMHSDTLSDLHDVFESEGRKRVTRDEVPHGVIEVWM